MNSYKRLTQHDKDEIMKCRALGYGNQEKADRIGCSVPTISYHLKQVREKAKSENNDDLFWALVAGVAGIGLLELMRRLKE